MTAEEIKRNVESYISQSKEGHEVENQKIDFKERWYDLSTGKGINEFLKDTSAIVNTVGLDGLIIIGYNAKANTYHDSKFSDCKLKDSSQIPDLINKRVDKLFDVVIHNIDIEGHQLNVIQIPPSLDKPHVIRNYQTFDIAGVHKRDEEQKVFVRRGTTTRPASKDDFELMYYDRKNIIPEYKIIAGFHSKTLELSQHRQTVLDRTFVIRSSIPFTFENIGRRPVAINQIVFELFLVENPVDDYYQLKFISVSHYWKHTIIIHPNEILNSEVVFDTVAKYNESHFNYIVQKLEKNRSTVKVSNLNLRLTNESLIQSEVVITHY
jgi:hypothetical protein